MCGAFEGDLIRPLGLVTLNFGYAEAQVNFLVSMLRDAGFDIEISPTASLGQRLKAFESAIRRIESPYAHEVMALFAESVELIDRRNSLVHACVLAEGRVVPNDPAKPEFRVTPEELTALAERAFNWKERLNAAVQLRLLPSLSESSKQRHG